MDELYLDNIDEYVHDHNKIVTYKWLSLTLGVHVNTAKQMLFHYLDHKRKESSAQLHATYLVSGKCEDNGHSSHKVSVVREEQLEDFKAKLSLIVSEHVYSVQKALLRDSGPLYSVDYDAVKDNLKDCSRFSAIRCADATPLTPLEQQQAREQQCPPSPPPQPQSRPAANGHAKPPAKQQKGIMGMFGNKAAAAAPKKPEKEAKAEMKEEAAPTPAVDVPKSKPAAKANPMMHFFGSQATKKPDRVKQEEAAPSSSSAQQPEQSLQPQKKQEKKKQEEKKQEKKQEAATAEPAKEEKKKKESRSKTKRIEDSDGEDESMEKKKRRRIKKPEPDSSDEDVIPDSPTPMESRQLPPPSPKKEVEPVSHSHQGSCDKKIRNRRRVLKSRTFIDDEGCIVTEKGYESESYSEAEDDVPPPKHAAKAAAKPAASNKDEEKKSQKKAAASANKGTKQASIMGFFQKK